MKLSILLFVLTTTYLKIEEIQAAITTNDVPQLFMSTFPTSVASNISEKCIKDSQAYANALLSHTPWAVTMYETSGKFPDTYSKQGPQVSIRSTSTGLFDECLTVDAQWNDANFQGQYCMATFNLMPVDPANVINQSVTNDNWMALYQLPFWFNTNQESQQMIINPTTKTEESLSHFYVLMLPSISYCIPSSCSGHDFASAVAQQVGRSVLTNVTSTDGVFFSSASILTIAGDTYCYTRSSTKEARALDGPDITVIVVLCLIGLAVVTATLHEGWCQYKGTSLTTERRSAVALLHCFSALNNCRKLMSTKTSPSDLRCLHGIRFLSATWVIMYHVHVISTYQPSYNKYMMTEDELQWPIQTIGNALISVDTFFLLSGILVAISLLRELDRNMGRFNIPLFYIHRYLRLTPVYAVILGFVATLLVHLGAGPQWEMVREMRDACRTEWWANLLYVNNYVNPVWAKKCMVETWYMACDMQLFWLSPLFIYPLWRWRRAGMAWVLLAMASFLGALIAMYTIWELPPTDMGSTRYDASKGDYYFDYYFQMWPRMPHYLLGILLGWILHRTKGSRIQLNKIAVITGWILAWSIGLAVLYGLVPYLDQAKVPVISLAVSSSYGSLHRLAWSAAVGWVIFACLHGYGGLVNRFLSWKGFIPAARLTYVAYLFHWNFLKTHLYGSRKPYYYLSLDQAIKYVSAVWFAFLAAFVICLLVETPFLNLERLLIPSSTRKTDAIVKDFMVDGISAASLETRDDSPVNSNGKVDIEHKP